ncbi:MAG: PQQ-binding-like beta-propeller repeat protein [bacterium]|nr:PQQ-binding-like beta-propeller repeat protein [bacterium]
MTQDPRTYLKEVISQKVFIPRGKENFVSPGGNQSNWIFDFRKILLKPRVIRAVTELFLKEFPDTSGLQIGGIEVAAIPLVTGMIMSLSEREQDTDGFFIRKSRKKDGLLRMIEGEVNEKRIILVDDILNTGQSFIRQVEILESLGKKVDAIFAILRFRSPEYYKYFHDRGIRIVSLFTLDDFAEALGVANLPNKKEAPVPMLFRAEWCFKSENPNYFHVIPKSAPVIADQKVYFGADNGTFWALNQSDGSIAWQYSILGRGKKMIFSSPALYKDIIYFGAYDGNFYALDTNTGKKKWVFMEADWINSSPVIAQDVGLIFVGLEFGLWKKRGGLVALDAATGEKRWEYLAEGRISSSPAFSSRRRVVLASTDHSVVYAFNVHTGKLLWELKIEGEVRASFAFDKEEQAVTFCSSNGHAYVLEMATGRLLHKIEVGESLYSTPLIYDGRLYIASLDKHLYCFGIETGNLLWKFETKGRIFSSPLLVDEKIYIGSNDGRFYEVEAETGKNTAFFQATERITAKSAYNPITKNFFVPTFANEIYCLKRKQEK